jgi:S1-C subfamily serine protease
MEYTSMRSQQLSVLANILLFAAVLTAAPQAATPQESATAGGKNSSEKLPFADARNMTVMVFFADPPPRRGMLPIAHADASGSGVWVGKTGYVATCQHVIASWHGPFKIGFARNAYVAEGGVTITIGASVNLWDADLVASDPDSDVAILKAHVSPGNAEPPPLVTGVPIAGERVITPQIPVSPKGAVLRTDFPASGETLLLAGYPIWQRTLILQIGPATGVNFLEGSTNHVASGLRIFLSLVSNPGNSGGPIFDTKGRVVGLLEGNLLAPVTQDLQGVKYQAYCGWAPIGPDGRPNLDSAGNPPPPPAPCWQNSGISYAVPARSIAELAKKNNIDLE